MILFKKGTDLRNWLDAQQKQDYRCGFVPTMGALHAGHISLIHASKSENPVTVCSIFVNPTQFNDPKDFAKYPVTIEKDIDMLEEAGCDILFLPSVMEMYPEGPGVVNSKYELGRLETILEGKYRPGHFQGVCMIVHRLLEIVRPSQLYLGQKDYQQCLVIKKLVELIGMKDTPVNVSPTLREKDGLAMSSRNTRLNAEERKRAPMIHESLLYIKNNRGKIPVGTLKKRATDQLTAAGFKVDYVEIASADSLESVSEWEQHQSLVALVAAFNNEVRLIDNMPLQILGLILQEAVAANYSIAGVAG